MKGRGTTRVIRPLKHTTATIGSKLSEAFVPGWGNDPGHGQHRERIDAREAMGQKKTPLGGVRLKP